MRSETLDYVVYGYVGRTAYENAQGAFDKLEDELDEGVGLAGLFDQSASSRFIVSGHLTPGGPCINATSLEARANLTACLWDSFNMGSMKSKSLVSSLTSFGHERTGVGESRPNSTRIRIG